ncbi:ArsR/SmtB family transcription factor [Galbitalea soli]|uniref:Helix-turn-helix transcriptional regulator n=1 Tax=Galbitalea soli TaxID=1268042 RepID=A0A7C9TS11_9MICO|nr:helix-turn-helix domain-containing protein [Galbitalea soli]NEM91704.1 helix-turn-helix transcriptional regulator [Galbitalea soli]NYJ30400.1 DNA-binding transcriptional ArsR family regulator [Galbitalea soli]
MSDFDDVHPAQPTGPRALDLAGLKALAHPLRVQIIDALSTYGASTASGLAERLRESSGATSYHLRQLEKHGFVREVEGKGTERERWWERVPGGIAVMVEQIGDSPAARSAAELVTREFQRSRESALQDFIVNGYSTLSPEWMTAATVSSANLRLTAEQLAALVGELEGTFHAALERYRDLDEPGARPVQVHFNAFPVVDGTETATPQNP